ncbi:hypothetical protein MML48_2g00018172 [Holotrichia oblita]|uniref:Uncharacterized protein n=1 Tax=Holotrichia oblita TaxID=644536 RepID=A0ACB9TMM3_HOLOL|nr:hypothetical protein MML48_2g00018172 [Holotrichia oblita]
MASDMSSNVKEINIDIDKYRNLVQSYINLHIYDAALYWADKIAVSTNNNPRDVYWLAQCMYLLKQYHRAAHLLRSHNLDKMYVLCNYLTVKCLFDANELNEALRILNTMDLEVFLQNGSESEFKFFDDTPQNQVQSSVLLLKGKILEAMDNRGLAADCYRQALQSNNILFRCLRSISTASYVNCREDHDIKIEKTPLVNDIMANIEENSIFSRLQHSLDLVGKVIGWRYLTKATSLDRLFGPAWLAYGHSFAIENEHDQAMAAYFKASQLMKGNYKGLFNPVDHNSLKAQIHLSKMDPKRSYGRNSRNIVPIDIPEDREDDGPSDDDSPPIIFVPEADYDDNVDDDHDQSDIIILESDLE